MNSKVLPFIVLAGIVLLTAVVWNTFKSDEPVSKTDYKTENVVQQLTTKKAPENTVKAEKIVINDYDNLATTNVAEMTLEERKEVREKAANYMTLSMQYPTSQQAISALKSFKNAGNDDMAKSLLSYIRKTFPEASIPKELID